MQNRVYVITGANAGIGKATATALAHQGARVIMLCRNQQRGEAARAEIASGTANNKIDLILCDLADLKSVRHAAHKVLEKTDRLDVLINNAGIYLPRRQLTVDGFEATFQINHLGHFELTRLLLPLLRSSAPSRIVSVSSGAHRMGWLNFRNLHQSRFYNGMVAYCRWKLANILFTRELARRLEGSGVTANALHPGAVRSEFAQDEPGLFKRGFMLARPLMISPKTGALTSIFLATSPDVEEVSGQYFEKCRRVHCARQARNQQHAERLWQLSEELCEQRRTTAP